ncbi:MAG: peptide-methionine (R)-S-oxide reductase MsrB [Magnetococcales bacterium]|nr:peptide-methionine (R)-S-oxide reductase MsrB [Magnetococcales bacterium]
MTRRITKPDAEWRQQLTEDQYRVCRQKGTEPPFTGKYYNAKDAGVYRCACCGEPLFKSSTKFDSGTGWPSFWEPISKEAVREESDSSHFMVRVEVLCGACDAHLGHVFDDGPQPTGLRYCINSISLDLKEES